MQKVKSNASWKELTADQLKALDKWLFEEGMSHAEAWAQAQAQFRYKGSLASLKRYFVRRRKERTLQEFTELRDELAEIGAAPGDVAALRTASMKLLGRFLFRLAQQSPDKIKEWVPVASLLVQNDHNEVLREAKAEEHRMRRELKAKDHKLRREAMAAARERFQFKVMERALAALPELKELAEARKDPRTRRYEENARVNRAMRALGITHCVHPESEEEEAEMIAAKKEREAQRQREQLINAEPPTPSSQYYREHLEEQMKEEEENWEMCGEYEI